MSILPYSSSVGCLSFSALVAFPIHHNNVSKAKTKTPQILDKSKALIIVEKTCYISQINIRYENPSLDPSRPELPRLDCIAAGRRLPCSLCLSRQAGAIAFTPSTPEGLLPILSLPKTNNASKPSIKKKDKLNKKERTAAEKHFLKFGESIRQVERFSDSHKYRPRSSYFPLDVLTSILDNLFIIHFPSHLNDLLDQSWIYYNTHGTALYDSIIDIQTCIDVGRAQARELAKSKRQDKRQLEMESEDENETRSESLNIEPELEEPLAIDQTSSYQQGSTRKRQAMEDIINSPKRRRAPRAVQPSVAQVQEQYGPRYQTRRRGHIIGLQVGGPVNDGKENNSQGMYLRPRT